MTYRGGTQKPVERMDADKMKEEIVARLRDNAPRETGLIGLERLCKTDQDRRLFHKALISIFDDVYEGRLWLNPNQRFDLFTIAQNTFTFEDIGRYSPGMDQEERSEAIFILRAMARSTEDDIATQSRNLLLTLGVNILVELEKAKPENAVRT